MTRRSFLAAACAAPTLAQQQIGPPPHVKGPKVFLDYDQVELDAAYDQSVYAPNQRQIGQRLASRSDLVRTRLGAPLRKAYGPTEIKKLDIYRPNRPNAPGQIFIHGGARRVG